MKPNDSNSNLVLPVNPINISPEVSNNGETVFIMTSHPQGHTTIKGSDYIIIDNKGSSIVVERQVNPLINENQQNKYNQQMKGLSGSSVNPITSPATDALDYILEDTKPNSEMNNTVTMDDNSLLLDLNDLLRRDPTFASLEDSKQGYPTSPQFISTTPNIEALNAANITVNNRQGLAIPGSKQPVIPPSATITSGQSGHISGGIGQQKINVDMEGSFGSSGASSNEKTTFYQGSLGSTSPSFFPSNQNTNNITKAIPETLIKMDTSALISGLPICTSPFEQLSSGGSLVNNPIFTSNVTSMNMINRLPSENRHGPTLAQLNSPTDNDAPSGLLSSETGIKMEITDIDDLDALFLSSSSANVSFGFPQSDIKPQIHGITKQVTNPLSPLSQQIKQEPGLPSMNNSSFNNRNVQTSNAMTLTNMNFWQATTDEMLFGTSSTGEQSNTSGTVGGSSTGTGAALSGTMTSLSSSVPVNLFHNVSSPLSDILTDLSPSPVNTSMATTSPITVSGISTSLRSAISPTSFLLGTPMTNPLPPPNTPTQSSVGPTRNSTLHKLLMQRKGDGPITGRPSPVRSPESRKTLEQMRNSLSISNPLISQQLLSRSAPTSNPLASGNIQTENRIWGRREPRPHISSVCSVDASSIADDVNDVLSGLSPSDDLQDIVSDDEEDELPGSYPEYKESSDDDSDFEGTSPSLARLSTSAGSSGGSGKKTERHFWQYNVQAKGPKGQKIVIDTKMEDPHTLNDIVDPVFSGDVKLQGIKHSGKARRGDGNDLTANPRKLAAIGKELESLSRVINDMTPVSEMPFGARCKSRKEKNKLASRACRLKKKAQHEANKVKCDGLLEEHRQLATSLERVKGLLLCKMDPQSSKTQTELTAELNRTVDTSLDIQVAGNTTDFVNKTIERNLPYV